jgi:DNA-binding IclR family transcriptional regulator
MVSMIRHKLAIDVGEEERFLQALRDCGYLEQDEPKYELRIALANAPHLIKIDKNFPALTRPGVSSLVGNDHSSRIMDVRYELDVTGMGMADGTATFVEALGLHN